MNLLYRKAPRALVVFRRKKSPNLPLHLCVIIKNGSSSCMPQSYYLHHFDCALSLRFSCQGVAGLWTSDDHCCRMYAEKSEFGNRLECTVRVPHWLTHAILYRPTRRQVRNRIAKMMVQ